VTLSTNASKIFICLQLCIYMSCDVNVLIETKKKMFKSFFWDKVVIKSVFRKQKCFNR